MSIRIILADNHEVVRQGISLLINQQNDMDVVGQATDGREAIKLAADLQPDVVILEVSMPNLIGVDSARQMLKDTPHMKVDD